MKSKNLPKCHYKKRWRGKRDKFLEISMNFLSWWKFHFLKIAQDFIYSKCIKKRDSLGFGRDVFYNFSAHVEILQNTCVRSLAAFCMESWSRKPSLRLLHLCLTFAHWSPATLGFLLFPMLVDPVWLGPLHFLSLYLECSELRFPQIRPLFPSEQSSLSLYHPGLSSLRGNQQEPLSTWLQGNPSAFFKSVFSQ